DHLNPSWAFIKGVPADKTQIRVVAQSEKASYSFKVHKYLRPDVGTRYAAPAYEDSGFSCTIQKRDLEPGHYTLWLELAGSGGPYYVRLKEPFVSFTMSSPNRPE